MHEDEKNANAVTREGAVEIREEDLDRVSGGLDYLKHPASEVPTDQFSAGAKGLETYVDPKDPSIGLLSEPQKKV